MLYICVHILIIAGEVYKWEHESGNFPNFHKLQIFFKKSVSLDTVIFIHQCLRFNKYVFRVFFSIFLQASLNAKGYKTWR